MVRIVSADRERKLHFWVWSRFLKHKESLDQFWNTDSLFRSVWADEWVRYSHFTTTHQQFLSCLMIQFCLLFKFVGGFTHLRPDLDSIWLPYSGLHPHLVHLHQGRRHLLAPFLTYGQPHLSLQQKVSLCMWPLKWRNEDTQSSS